MLVPELAARSLRGLRVIDLHEPHAALGQPAGHQALRAEDRRRRVVEAVEPAASRAISDATSNASGASACIRKASSNESIRASSAAVVLARFAVQCVELAAGRRAARAGGRRELAAFLRLAIGSSRFETSVPW